MPIITIKLPKAARRFQTQGVIGYLTKPVTVDTLRAQLKQLDQQEATILLVDDDPDFVRLLTNLLTLLPHPYRILRAYGGRQALEVMQAIRPDLVFLDLIMPDLNGEQVIAQMRCQERLANIPVVIVSAMDRVKDGMVIASPLVAHFGDMLDGATGARLLEAMLNELAPSYLASP